MVKKTKAQKPSGSRARALTLKSGRQILCAQNYDGNRFTANKFNNLEFFDCNLSECIFSDCIFLNCTLQESCLDYSIFQNCIFINSHIIDCELKETQFLNCINFVLRKTKESTYGLIKCDLFSAIPTRRITSKNIEIEPFLLSKTRNEKKKSSDIPILYSKNQIQPMRKLKINSFFAKIKE